MNLTVLIVLAAVGVVAAILLVMVFFGVNRRSDGAGAPRQVGQSTDASGGAGYAGPVGSDGSSAHPRRRDDDTSRFDDADQGSDGADGGAGDFGGGFGDGGGGGDGDGGGGGGGDGGGGGGD